MYLFVNMACIWLLCFFVTCSIFSSIAVYKKMSAFLSKIKNRFFRKNLKKVSGGSCTVHHSDLGGVEKSALPISSYEWEGIKND